MFTAFDGYASEGRAGDYYLFNAFKIRTDAGI